MTRYEYKVCPSPTKARKAQGVKSPEGRFARTVEELLNAQAADGWEYLRSDILPSDERQGLTSTQTVYRTLLVFRRPIGAAETAAEDVIATATTIAEAVVPDQDNDTDHADAAPPGERRDAPEQPETPESDPDPDKRDDRP